MTSRGSVYILCGLFLLTASTSFAQSVNQVVDRAGLVVPATPSAKDIGALLTKYFAMEAGSPFAKTPSYESPYLAGALNPAFLNRGLAAVNLFRYVAGLSSHLSADTEWNDIAQ